MSSKNLKLVKIIVHVLCLLPLVRLIFCFYTNNLTANPVEFITHSTGTWALAILLISLAITPLRKIKTLNWLISLRRMIGLYSFFYASLHFLTYIVFDLNFNFSGVAKDIAKRPFITIGFAAFVLLLPLAITSNKFSIRKLTGKRWNQLHRLVYPAAILGIVHFYWLVKSDVRQPVIYAVILILLFAVRLVGKAKKINIKNSPPFEGGVGGG
jgi:methionine sulfoxide reductase heme-binding subunit